MLSALNSSKSAFGSVELQGARMFSQYECLTRDGLPLNTPNRESASVHCRIQVKVRASAMYIMLLRRIGSLGRVQTKESRGS